MANVLLEGHNLTIKHKDRFILNDVSLAVTAGTLMTIIGPNGSGKSTLLKALLDLIPLTVGQVYKRQHLKIGYMPQKLQLDHMLPLTVRNFLQLSYSQINQPDDHRIDIVLEQVSMSSHQQTLMNELSGGEFQRTLLARALLQEPDLFILDEPVQGVDVMGQADIYQLIQTLRDERGCSIILVSHDLHFVHAASDHVICMNTHICCQGKPEDIRTHPNYLSLFGHGIVPPVALYPHIHDHQHGPQCDTQRHH